MKSDSTNIKAAYAAPDAETVSIRTEGLIASSILEVPGMSPGGGYPSTGPGGGELPELF